MGKLFTVFGLWQRQVGGEFLNLLVSEGSNFEEKSFGIWVWSGIRTLSHISLERSLQSFKGVFAGGQQQSQEN